MTLRCILLAAGIATIPCFACDNKNPASSEGPAPSATTSAASAAPPPAPARGSEDRGGTTSARAGANGDAGVASVASVAPVASAASAASPGSPPDGGFACGTKANPCPLQGWMREHSTPAMESGDAAKMGAVLEQIAKLGPPGYGEWERIANDGAAAGKSGDFDAAKAACRACHDKYKKPYKTELRDRRI